VRSGAQRHRFVAAGSLAIVAVCVAVASPISALTSANTHDVKVHRWAAGASTAQCPQGEHVSFGGVIAQYRTPATGGQYVLPTGMRRTADDKLTVFGFNNTRAVEGHLTGYAYCDPGPVSKAVERTEPYGDGGANAIATCPAGTVVVGGGFDTHSTPRHHALVDRLERVSARQWRVASTALTAESETLTAIAYCAAGPAPKLSTATVKVSPHSAGTARAKCPSGTSLVFGGVLAPRTGFPYQAAHSAQVDAFGWTATSGAEWVVTAFNVGSRTGDLSALAYCR
jgi:hypothetical protein